MPSIDQEYQQISRYLRGAAGASVFLLGVGSVFYHIVEKLSWLDALYFSVISLATVGYGDIAPKTGLGKLFTIFYVLMGIGIIATFANLSIKRATLKRELRQTAKKSPRK